MESLAMFPLLSGLMTGGASLLGSIFSSNTSAANTQAQIAGQEQMQSQSEAFNASQAEMNRDFQQQMSSTAYQRASSDMKAAGLNPMMMFGSGGPASVPSGSTASVGTPTMPTPQKSNPFGKLGENVAQGLQAAVSAKAMDKTTEEIANLHVENQVLEAEARRRAALASQEEFRVTGAEVDQRKAAAIRAINPSVFTTAEQFKYGADVAGKGGDAFWSVFNPLKGLGKALTGSSAKSVAPTPPEGGLTPTQRNDVFRGVDNYVREKGGLTGSGGRPSQEMINEWFRKGGTQDKLGGRNAGTGGSYD